MANFKEPLLGLSKSLSATRKVNRLALNKMMSGFSAGHTSMAKLQRHSLSRNRSDRSEMVRSMQSSYKSHFLMAGKELRYRLSSHAKQTHLWVSEMRKNSTNERVKSAKLVAEKYNEINKSRLAWNHQRIKSGRLMLESLSTNRYAAAHLYAQERIDFVNENRANSQMLLSEFGKAQSEIAAQIKLAASSGRAILSEFMAGLKAGETTLTGGSYQAQESTDQVPVSEKKAHFDLTSGDARAKITALPHLALAPSDTNGSDATEQDVLPVAADAAANHKDGFDSNAVQKTKAWRKMSDDDKVLHLIAQNSAGISVVDLCEQSALHAVVVGKILKRLFSSGSVNRSDDAQNYFPV